MILMKEYIKDNMLIKEYTKDGISISHIVEMPLNKEIEEEKEE
jgi:hypothetical protein